MYWEKTGIELACSGLVTIEELLHIILYYLIIYGRCVYSQINTKIHICSGDYV
jgi:hypothetical protein